MASLDPLVDETPGPRGVPYLPVTLLRGPTFPSRGKRLASLLPESGLNTSAERFQLRRCLWKWILPGYLSSGFSPNFFMYFWSGNLGEDFKGRLTHFLKN